MSSITDRDLELLREDAQHTESEPPPPPPSPRSDPWDIDEYGLLREERAVLDAALARIAEREQDRYAAAEPAPFFCVAPLTPEQALADERRDVARYRLEKKIKRLHETPAPRHLRCGHGATIHIRRPREGGGVEDALIRPRCGRSDCPHCWRRRICRTYRRASVCVLDADGGQYLPRVAPVYLAETTWREWEALDRSLRRQHGGRCGRIRVRQSDDRVLVVAAQPFRGARPLPPHEAYAAVAAAIDRLHTGRHAYRQLGEWSDRRASAWRAVHCYGEPIPLAEVQDALRAAGVRSRPFAGGSPQGILWRADSEADAAALAARCVAPFAAASECGHARDRSSVWPHSDAVAVSTPWEVDDADLAGSRWG